jgi:DNA primase
MGDVPNVVAPQGTALTAAHGKILRRYTDDIILCFDGDAAGQRAAARAFDDLLVNGIPFRVASIPPPDDPDSYIKKFGRDAFVRLLIGANDFYEFYLKYLCTQHDLKTTSGRQQIVQKMNESLHKASSPTVIDTYAQRTAQILGVAADAIRLEFKKIPSQKNLAAATEDESFESAAANESEMPRPSPAEFHLLKLLLLHDELAATVALHLELDWIQNPITRQIVEQRLAAQKNETWKNLAAFLNECASPEMRNLVTEVVAEERKIPNPEMQLADVITKMRNQFLDRQIASLTQKVSQPEISDAEKIELLQQQKKLREQKRSPLVLLK